MRYASQALLLFMTVLLSSSCMQMTGNFAFKGFFDDTYKKIEGTPEFPSDEEVRWVFAFSKKQAEREIGVVYLKREAIWVEILTATSRIDLANSIVYGTLKGLEPGKYQIVLTDVRNDNREIARKDFVIYAREDDDDR